MNPFLVREVQPPLIYVGGDGRLKQHTIEQIYLHLLLLLFLLPCSSSSSFFVRSSSLQGDEPRGSRGGQTDLGQPIAAARPDGVPPARGVSGPQKHPPDCLRTALPAGSPST